MYKNRFAKKTKKARSSSEQALFGAWYAITSHCARDLAAAQAAGAGVDVLGAAVHDGLNALDIGLPGAVGATVRVAHCDTEETPLSQN